MRVRLIALIFASGTLAHAQAPTSPGLIVVRDLGTLQPFDYADAVAINNRGHVVGEAGDLPFGVRVPFLWTPETGFTQLTTESGTPTDINDRDQVIGILSDPYRGFLWSAGELTDLWPFYPSAINDSGQIAGDCLDSGEPCVWHEGVVHRLRLLPGAIGGGADGINNHGEIVGKVEVSPFEFKTVLWPSVDGDPIELVGVGQPWAINDRGEVVAGSCCIEPAVVWHRGRLRGPNSADQIEVNSINAQGLAVGAKLATGHGVLWTPDGALTALLPDGSDVVSRANGINDRGQIVGTSGDLDGRRHAVMWQSLSSLYVDTPNSSTRWGVNTRQRIAWTYSGDAAQFLIEISRDSGETWADLARVANEAGNSQNFNWTVTGPLTSAARFRVTAVGEPHATDVNDTDIRIAHPTVEVETPNNSSHWGINTRQRIAWTYDGNAPQFQIDISRDGGATWNVLSVVPNKRGASQNFFWIVTGAPTGRARLRVTAIGDEQATDVNNADIRIAPAAMEFVLPHRRSVVQTNTAFRLFWKHNLGARVPVVIEVSSDGETSWRTIASQIETRGPRTSSFRWTVDLPPTSQARLRVRALDGSGASAVSDVFVVRTNTTEITAGGAFAQMVADPFNGGWDLSAPTVRASGLWPLPSAACDVNRGGCREGETVDFSNGVGGSEEPFLTDLIIDGRQFAAGDVFMDFDVDPVVIRRGGVSAPFTMKGLVRGLATDGKTVLVQYEIFGRGTMSAQIDVSECCGTETLLTTTVSYALGPSITVNPASGAR